MSAKNDFPVWLVQELEKRNWIQSTLATHAGLSRQAISDYVNGKRKNYESDALVSIARAFGLPPDEVFRAAGIFPPKPSTDSLTDEGIHILQQLEGEYKDEALRQLRLRLQVQEERGKSNVGKRKARPSEA